MLYNTAIIILAGNLPLLRVAVVLAAHTGDCRSPNALLHFSRYASCPNLYHALFFNRYINSVTANLEIRQSDAKLHFDTSFPPLKKNKNKKGKLQSPCFRAKTFRINI